MDRIRSHSAEAAEGRVFLALVAMMMHAVMQERLEKSRKEMGRRVCPREAMLDLRNIKLNKLPNGTMMLSELSKRQRKILQLLKVPEEVFSVN